MNLVICGGVEYWANFSLWFWLGISWLNFPNQPGGIIFLAFFLTKPLSLTFWFFLFSNSFNNSSVVNLSISFITFGFFPKALFFRLLIELWLAGFFFFCL